MVVINIPWVILKAHLFLIWIGSTFVENLAWSCYGCNGRKHTKTSYCDPETKLEVALFHPRQQLWSEHFS
ncbi:MULTISPECIES: hypothetical protein [unclassified Nostoc]|uniref:hypothetical protein n=1 Tax=unclassified Nostoc TaxID=2593658 RepID=UPI002AD43C75|nr:MULTISPECIES: hypothetical protein [unclassified Nostoc]